MQTQRNVNPFFSLYHICASDVKSVHTHYTHINVSFGDVMYFGLRGEGRRNQEGME